MTSVTVTGTRLGITLDQWRTAEQLLTRLFKADGEHEFHDGDSMGADDQIHNSVQQLRRVLGWQVTMHGHPCNLDQWRAWNVHDVTHDVAAPMIRNRAMVNAADVVIAMPYQYEEQVRGSGTWGTIRYARHTHTRLIVVWPDGSIEEEPNEEGTTHG